MAQELLELGMDDAVVVDKDGYYNVDYSRL